MDSPSQAHSSTSVAAGPPGDVGDRPSEDPVDLSAIGVTRPNLTRGPDALGLKPLARSAESGPQADSRGATPEPSFTDRVEISPVARSLAQAATGSSHASAGGGQPGQDFEVDFLPPIVRSILVRLSDRFYQAPGIEEQITQRLESELALAAHDSNSTSN
jgi:hypothetical protein